MSVNQDSKEIVPESSSSKMTERKMSALFTGRKRSSCGTNPPHHVKFNIGGGATADDLTVLHEKANQLDSVELSATNSQTKSKNEEDGNELDKTFSESGFDFTESSSEDSTSNYNSISRNNSLLPVTTSNQQNMFVELYDLKMSDEKNLTGVWEESARWIKFEEDVEGVDCRWGQPHVAFLSLHSIIQLRRCISKGIVLLDSKAKSFEEVCEQIAKAMVNQGHCKVDTQRIIDILMLKHNHVPDRRISRNLSVLFDRGEQHRPQRTRSAAPLNMDVSNDLQSPISQLSGCPTSPSNLLPSNLLSCGDDDSNDSKPDHPLLGTRSPSKVSITPNLDEDGERVHKRSISSFVFNKFRRNFSKPGNLDEDDFVMRNLPLGSETAQVFSGSIKELVKVRFVMVRLKDAIHMPEIVERPIPVRYVFVILGPPIPSISFHELGRAISTVIANRDFNSLAFQAKDQHELVAAIDEFLHGSILIPPGEIDSKRLLSGDQIKRAFRKMTQKDDSNGQAYRHGGSNGVRPIADKNANLEAGALQPKRQRFRYFGGMIDDLKNRYPQYKSDYTDAFNFQCLTSIVFMFFASFAPAITFGGLMGKYTEERIGMIETLFAQSLCGLIWGLFAAQPLLIMSATGPVLIFEASLYTTCKSLGMDFMVVRLYAGVWIFLISIILVAVDGSRLLKYVSRFTEDIFATLISVIFIAESFHFIYHTFVMNPVENFKYYETVHSNCGNSSDYPNLSFAPMRSFPVSTNLTKASNIIIKRGIEDHKINKSAEHAANAVSGILNNSDLYKMIGSNSTASKYGGSSIERSPCSMAEPNTALLTSIIMLSTFSFAFLLKKLRESFYLGRHLRRAIGDFGVLISIAIVALTVQIATPDPYIQRLEMPDHINFTNPVARGHGLIITITWDSLTHNWLGIFVALIAALLVLILLFVETEITELLVLRKERGCTKGGGMNFDLILLAVCCLLCSILGLPWMCAAVLQSLSHCSSLTVFKKQPPGSKPQVDYVIEQRLTTIGISLLIGLIAFAGSYLRLPLASLFGVFLYLGIMNLCGVQLIERCVLFFIPEKYFPSRPYTEHVSFWRMNLYTFIQIALLGFIYIVKHYKTTALAFPFVLMIFIALRQFGLPLIFSNKELTALDGDNEDECDEWNENGIFNAPPIPV